VLPLCRTLPGIVQDSIVVAHDEAGVRGVRINVPPVKAHEAGFAARLLPRIERLRARCREIAWQLDFLTTGGLTVELMPTPRRLDLDFSQELEPGGSQDELTAGAQSLPSSDHLRRGPE
jgi:hypothetical protein